MYRWQAGLAHFVGPVQSSSLLDGPSPVSDPVSPDASHLRVPQPVAPRLHTRCSVPSPSAIPSSLAPPRAPLLPSTSPSSTDDPVSLDASHLRVVLPSRARHCISTVCKSSQINAQLKAMIFYFFELEVLIISKFRIDSF